MEVLSFDDNLVAVHIPFLCFSCIIVAFIIHPYRISIAWSKLVHSVAIHDNITLLTTCRNETKA